MEAIDLSPDELREAEKVIRRAGPGLYTLPEIYGSDWHTKVSPTTFGRRFKAAVAAERLSGITLHPERTTTNKTQYLVHDH